MLLLIIQTGPDKTSIPAKEDLKHSGKPKNMNGHSVTSRTIPATYSFPPSWKKLPE